MDVHVYRTPARTAMRSDANPYLDEYRALHGGEWNDAQADWMRTPMWRTAIDFVGSATKRRELVQRYAWSIPTEEALAAVAAHGPVLDPMAGSGYWVRLLQNRGVDAVATDMLPPESVGGNHYHNQDGNPGFEWTTVEQMRAVQAVRKYGRGRSLFLSWPPYDDSNGHHAVCAHKAVGGSVVIYVGEGPGGCTGDDAFHRLLDDAYEVVQEVAIPQWPGIHDRLTVYRRRF